MHSMSKDWRNRNNINMFDPRRYNMESYYTSAQKKEMKHSFGDELLSNLHLLPDPLKKNLADSIITSESLALKSESKRIDKQFLNTVIEPEPSKMETGTNQSHIQAPFGGISNFLSGVFNVISGAMANWRPKSPAPYYDCFDDGATQGPPLSWHDSKNEVQNKSARENDLKSKSDMNIDCKTAVAQCEDKLNKVRLLLTTKAIETPKLRPRRPRKAFVEAGSIEERFEDAFAPEDFVNVSSDTCIEYYSSYKIHDEVLSETAAPKIKIEQIVHENTDIVKAMPENTVKCEESKQLDTAMVKDRTETKLDINSLVEDTIETKLDVKIDENEAGKTKEELVSSCEDKLSKLKALLQEKRKKNTHTMPSPNSNMEPVGKSNEIHSKPPKPHDKTKDKRYKNPCRTTNKSMKTRMRKSIQDDLVFAQELNVEDLSSAENSPTINRLSDNPLKKFADTNNCPNNLEYFDEVSGRFRSTSTTESEDSFQIVFNDSPKQNKMRCVSDCDSEDSFIVFEDSPDSCYTSNDVFGDSDESGSECTDSESDLSDTDDIQVTKLSHSLSRTLSDLTDGSLYEDNAFDEVDSAVRSVCDQISSQDIAECVPEVNVEPKSTGLLLNEEKKLLKRQQSPKSVHFSPHPPKVHVMRVWAFAARQARAGHWERCALDRDRFKRRIADVDMAVSWVLKPQHRSRVMFQRFMPWWNAQRRKEIAEKKERDARIKEEQRIEAERLEMEKLEQESKVDNESSDVIVNDKEQEQINESVNNDVTNNDSNYVIDKERKQINDETVMENEKKINEIKSKELKNKEMKKFNEHKNNDLKVMIKGKLNGLKSNGCIRNKSQLNDVKKIVQVNDNNDFTTKLRSEGLSST